VIEQLGLFDTPEPPQPAPAAPEPPEWRPAPDAGYSAAQEAARARGWALDWNGQQYTLWRPGHRYEWRYTYSPTLGPLLALIAPAPEPAEGPLPADLVDAGMAVGPLPHWITIHDDCSVGVTFALATLEQNIAAAREFLEAGRARLAAEAEKATTKAAKRVTRKKAS
jgi:hypothetical protein